VVKKEWFKEILISYLIMGHTYEKVNWDLFATVGNLKKSKIVQYPRSFLLLWAKVLPNAHKNRYFIWSFILELERISGGEFEIYSKSGCYFRAFLIKCNSLDQLELFYKKSILDLQWLGFNGSTTQDNFCFLSC
jgi:hypothetical protein